MVFTLCKIFGPHDPQLRTGFIYTSLHAGTLPAKTVSESGQHVDSLPTRGCTVGFMDLRFIESVQCPSTLSSIAAV